MEKNEKKSLSVIFLRFLIGFGSGFVGSMILGTILLLSWSIVGDSFSSISVEKSDMTIDLMSSTTHPLFLSLIVLAFFISILVATLMYGFLIPTVEESYQFRSTILSQVFFGNLIFLFLIIPLYIVTKKIFLTNGVVSIGALHAILVSVFTFSVIELLNEKKYLLVRLYGGILGILLFLFFSIIFLKGNTTILIFLILPLILGFLGAGNACMEIFYQWLYQNYGIDFLSTKTRFDVDYSEKKDLEIESDEEVVNV
jgi:MFS family permease